MVFFLKNKDISKWPLTFEHQRMLHICWWYSHDKKQASGAGKVNCMLHKRDLLTKTISSSRSDAWVENSCSRWQRMHLILSVCFDLLRAPVRWELFASGHVRLCHAAQQTRSCAVCLWNLLAPSNEWFHIRLYMAMMCRQLSSCRLYSWILFTWTSNMEDGLIFTLYSFSRYWANFTLLSCEKNHKNAMRQQRCYSLKRRSWITDSTCPDTNWL